ncbi:MAG TPA: nucleoside deaminase [Flavobacteriaceae bacterium]|nr:nucleoside deaminase [Flavobacteriaceae bacterium]
MKKSIYFSAFGIFILLIFGVKIFGNFNSVKNEINQTEKPITMKQEQSKNTLTKEDYQFLKRCLKLAEKAYKAGDKPFGSILVNTDGEIIAEARNRVNEINVLSHPEYELAKWAVENLSWEERKETRMYTSGEHCPMCSGAHAWAELGDLIYLSSGKQLRLWLSEVGAEDSPIQLIPAEKIINNITVKGPAEGELLEKIKDLQIKTFQRDQ